MLYAVLPGPAALQILDNMIRSRLAQDKFSLEAAWVIAHIAGHAAEEQYYEEDVRAAQNTSDWDRVHEYLRFLFCTEMWRCNAHLDSNTWHY